MKNFKSRGYPPQKALPHATRVSTLFAILRLTLKHFEINIVFVLDVREC
jgi:hypothetical protein